MNTETSTRPNIFISYSHDSDEHRNWVIIFADHLVKAGINVMLDAWDIGPGEDIAKYMEQSVRAADRVLLICTEAYVKKANDGVGGAGYETMIVTGELMRELGSTKFIPVVRQAAAPKVVPSSMGTRMYVDLSPDKHFDAEFEGLVRDLHKTPAFVKPAYGENPFPGPRLFNPPRLMPSTRRNPLIEIPHRFLYCDQPLGILDDFSNSKGLEVNLQTGSPLWLYVQPASRPARPFAADLLKKQHLSSGVMLQPIFWVDLHYVESVDGFGTFVPAGNSAEPLNRASSVAFAFDDGSVFYIDSTLIDLQCGRLPVTFIEGKLIRAFDRAVAYIAALGLEADGYWSAGLRAGPAGLTFAWDVGNGQEMSAKCMTSEVSAANVFDSGTTGVQALESFFETIWKSFGRTRPDVAGGYVAEF